MKKIMNGQGITLGTCYYPEHWEKKDWAEDLDRMLAAGIKTIRIAEFAWNIVEPEEGVYTYEYWDEFLDLCAEKGMQVIFGTPTATAPAWMTEKYPEVLNRRPDGTVIHHGERQQNNFSSEIYRRFSENITDKLAAHYGQHPAIIGWQLDNEFNCGCSLYYAESDTLRFREFLKKKYENIDALNKAWGTVFWNQTYNSFEEIHVPRQTCGGAYNPHLVLDFRRYISDTVCSFAKAQADIIRKYKKPDDFITTNGIFDNIDYRRMMKESLDDITFDSYPNFGYCLDRYEEGAFNDRNNSKTLAEVRAIEPVFGIMEQQSGANGWNTGMEAPTPRPGQITLWTMQSIANGADYVSYFRWRTCTFGTEMYWHGILDYSGRENRRYREVKDIYNKLDKIQEIAGAKYQAKAAVIRDYDNDWDSRFDVWHKRLDEMSGQALFETLQKTHTPFDYYRLYDDSEASDLIKYDVVFYPHPEIMTEARAKILQKYVENGGTLVIGCRGGQKDIYGRCTRELLPGLLKPLTGADVLEYSYVAPDEGTVTVDWDGLSFDAPLFNEILQAEEGAEAAAAYKDSYYAGETALIKKNVGAGTVYYFGAAFNESTVRAFLKKTGVEGTYADVIEGPECVEIAVREKEDRKYLFVLNFASEEVTVTLKTPVYEMLTEMTESGAITLPKYGVKVYRL